MKSGLAIIEMYEKRFRVTIDPIRREYLEELINVAMNQAYEDGKQAMLTMAKKHAEAK